MSFLKQPEWEYIFQLFIPKWVAYFSCRWVRAVEEFLGVLHSSPYMHVQKKVKLMLIILDFIFWLIELVLRHIIFENSSK